MKLRFLLLLIALLIPIGAIALAQGEQAPTDWETVAEGISYQEFTYTDPVPLHIHVARMDRANPKLIIESSIGQGRLSGGLEPVSRMAARYDQALNYWGEPTIPVSQTWGSRSDVVVAINGFYFGPDVEPPGVPWSGQIHSGWYAKRYIEGESLSGFVWKMDRSTFIGECVYHVEDKQVVYIEDGTAQHTHYLDGLNREREADELILYTSQYDVDTGTNANGIEVLIEMEVPTSISLSKGAPEGIIREIRNNQGSTPIPFDHVVLSAHGTAAAALREDVNVGSRVAIAQKVSNCLTSPDHDWTYAYAGVGGQFYFLRNGVIYDYSDKGEANVRDPRTAIAYNDDYIFFIVADGRDPGTSEGINIGDLAAFAKDTLGATEGIAQDGGGSSTMVINGRMVNRPFNPIGSCNAFFLPLVLEGQVATTQENLPAETSEEPDDPADEEAVDALTLVCPRWVANGMMMVLVEPMEKSETFSAGNLVATTDDADLYLGPGTNYGILTSLSPDATGEVAAHMNELDGVLAKGSYWWKVDFEDGTGWIPEDVLTPTLKTAPGFWRENSNSVR